LENLQKEIAEVSSKLNSLCNSKSDLQTNSVALAATNSSAIPTQTATDIVDEYLDQERHKSNLILYGLPEPSGADSSERKSNDEQCFRNLAKAEFKIDDLDIDQIFRLGKRTENKSRPLLVRLQDSQARKCIFRN